MKSGPKVCPASDFSLYSVRFRSACEGVPCDDCSILFLLLMSIFSLIDLLLFPDSLYFFLDSAGPITIDFDFLFRWSTSSVSTLALLDLLTLETEALETDA